MRPTPKCPRCGKRLRMKPGTKRTTARPLFQCAACLITHPESCEFAPGVVDLLGPEDFTEETNRP